MKPTPIRLTQLSIALALSLANSSYAASVSLSNVPLDVALNSANTIFIIDDSASMDYEMMLVGSTSNPFSDGVVYWGNSSFTNTAVSGKKFGYLFPTGAAATYLGTSTVYPFFVGDGRANQSSEWVVPPLPAYMYLRSSDYNPMYYNPARTYTPWPDARIGTTDVTYSNAPTTAARTHPYFSGNDSTSTAFSNSGTATTFNLGTTYFTGNNCSFTNAAPGSDYFRGFAGMSLKDVTVNGSNELVLESGNGTTTYPICYRAIGGTTWSKLTTTQARGSGATRELKEDYELAVPFSPAEFWQRRSTAGSTCAWPNCVTDPAGNQYDRRNIAAGYASTGRTNAQELQNFANWFTYYRNRKLLMAASMGRALDGLQDNYRQLKAGAILMHQIPGNSSTSLVPAIGSSNPRLFDFQSTNTSVNARGLIGMLYSTYVAAGTPTYAALNAISSIYGYSGPFTDQNTLKCSANSAMILTDGYVNEEVRGAANRPYYAGTTQGYPYGTSVTLNEITTNYTLTDLAKKNYNGLRWWNATDVFNESTKVFDRQTVSSSGKTINTYGITLGAIGTIYAGSSTALTSSTVFPTPSKNSATAIDDLWHAAIVSKGKLLTATDANTLDASINDIINRMFSSGTGTGLAYSNAKIQTGNNTVIQAGYDSGNWTGDVSAFSIYTTGTNAGYVNYSDNKWSAQAQLDQASTRYIATWNGTDGIPFTFTSLTSSNMTAAFNTQGQSDASDVISWLRGNRSQEGSLYRTRDHLLGDVINSTPVFVSEAFANYTYAGYSSYASSVNSTRKDVVYFGANDGMLHAVDASNGNELWAYVPRTVHANLNALSSPAYQHQFYVDGPMTAWDVQLPSESSSSSSSAASDGGSGSGTWSTVLIGGLGKGGKGYYALNITNPELVGDDAAAKEANLASKVLWEISTSTTGFANLGYTYGKPVIAKTADYGWVALLPSGYNTADKKGRLYIVKVSDGTLVKELEIDEPASGSAYDEVGLGQVQGVIDYKNAVSSQDTANLLYAYGGDLNGNLYRFDLSSDDADDWTVSKLATNLNTRGSANAGKAPITAAPDIALISTPNTYAAGETDTRDPRDKGTQRLMVFVGNGKLLHTSDFDSTDRTNGFYAIWDAWADTQDAEDKALVIGDSTGPCGTLTTCLMQVGHQQAANSLGTNNWGTNLNSALNAWWKTGGSWSEGPFTYAGDSRSKRGWFIEFSTTVTENVIHPPVVYNGKVLFTASTKASDEHLNGTCEKAYSSLYNLTADKGGSETGIPARINLGFGIASGVSIIQLPDGSTRASGGIKENSTTGLNTTGSKTACTDGAGCNFSTEAGGGSIAANATMRRYGWREIYR